MLGTQLQPFPTQWTLVFILLSGCNQNNNQAKLPLSGGYFLWRTSAHNIFVAPETSNSRIPMIPTKVIELNWNNHYIIGKQLVPISLRNYYKDQSNVYWILDLDHSKSEGPLSPNEFHTRVAQLRIEGLLPLIGVDKI
ncbi:MAG: DUF3997 domain-containing protein [Acidobacteria bacterium]|nr:DUF3997 domain-containing protein [Acidobacteriota bacterium]